MPRLHKGSQDCRPAPGPATTCARTTCQRARLQTSESSDIYEQPRHPFGASHLCVCVCVFSHSSPSSSTAVLRRMGVGRAAGAALRGGEGGCVAVLWDLYTQLSPSPKFRCACVCVCAHEIGPRMVSPEGHRPWRLVVRARIPFFCLAAAEYSHRSPRRPDPILFLGCAVFTVLYSFTAKTKTALRPPRTRE